MVETFLDGARYHSLCAFAPHSLLFRPVDFLKNLLKNGRLKNLLKKGRCPHKALQRDCGHPKRSAGVLVKEGSKGAKKALGELVVCWLVCQRYVTLRYVAIDLLHRRWILGGQPRLYDLDFAIHR